MAFSVYLRDNDTGECRWHVDETFPFDDVMLSMWTHGNYECDCNRRLFFLRAGGESDKAEIECGESRYSALGAVTDEGECILIDAQSDRFE